MTPLEEIALFGDVPMDLNMDLDSKVMLLSEVLAWEPDSIVWLTRSAGDNIDIKVGGALLGYGEIVVIENTFGVRVTDFFTGE